MPADERDFKLDLSTGAAASSAPATKPTLVQIGSPARPFISVHFACCAVYQRIYRDADGRHYGGRCPRCGRTIRFVIGPGGTASRSFTVS